MQQFFQEHVWNKVKHRPTFSNICAALLEAETACETSDSAAEYECIVELVTNEIILPSNLSGDDAAASINSMFNAIRQLEQSGHFSGNWASIFVLELLYEYSKKVSGACDIETALGQVFTLVMESLDRVKQVHVAVLAISGKILAFLKQIDFFHQAEIRTTFSSLFSALIRLLRANFGSKNKPPIDCLIILSTIQLLLFDLPSQFCLLLEHQKMELIKACKIILEHFNRPSSTSERNLVGKSLDILSSRHVLSVLSERHMYQSIAEQVNAIQTDALTLKQARSNFIARADTAEENNTVSTFSQMLHEIYSK